MVSVVPLCFRGWFWHVHHDVLLEYSEDVRGRIKYIKEHKPKGEVNIRLKVMKKVNAELVPGKLRESFKKLREAGKKWDEAGKKLREAEKKRAEASKKWVEVSKKVNAELVPRKLRIARKRLGIVRKKYDLVRKKWCDADKKCDVALDKWRVARDRFDEVYVCVLPQLNKLHERECGCKYWNAKMQKLVFGRGKITRSLEVLSVVVRKRVKGKEGGLSVVDGLLLFLLLFGLVLASLEVLMASFAMFFDGSDLVEGGGVNCGGLVVGVPDGNIPDGNIPDGSQVRDFCVSKGFDGGWLDGSCGVNRVKCSVGGSVGWVRYECVDWGV